MRQSVRTVIAGLLLGGLGAGAGAEVRLNEVLGSTAAEDCEFIELHNTGMTEVDLSGWSIELWDSDADKAFRTADADSPIKLGGRIDGGGYFLLANPEFTEHYEIEPDQPLRANAIENSSYTIVLRDDLGEIVDSVFVCDGGEGDKPNINGRVIRPDAEIRSADGRFVPPGFARLADSDDGTRRYRVLKFSPVPPPGATPGKPNAPATGENPAGEGEPTSP